MIGPDDVAEGISSFYEDFDEDRRLAKDIGPLEEVRSRELIQRHFPSPPAVVCDLGGATGPYSFWMAGLGYDVHLVDITPAHIEKALRKSKEASAPTLARAIVGDARHIEYPDDSFDGIWMHGPLYHLVNRADRVAALTEVRRVLKPGGILLAVAITRYASTIVGLLDGRVWNPDFMNMLRHEIATGEERRGNAPAGFKEAFFHRPSELEAEVVDAGLIVDRLVGVIGPVWMAKDFDDSWGDATRRETLLELARMLEDEPVLGPRTLAVARKAM